MTDLYFPPTIMEKICVFEDTNCYIWLGKPHPTGNYGRLGYEGKTGYAHRRVWEIFKGPIPPGFDVGHKCHDDDPTCDIALCFHRLCLNYEDHLELQPRQKNVLKGKTLARVNSLKTHCPAGHAYTLENTYWSGKNKRQRKCKICMYLRQADYRARTR